MRVPRTSTERCHHLKYRVLRLRSGDDSREALRGGPVKGSTRDWGDGLNLVCPVGNHADQRLWCSLGNVLGNSRVVGNQHRRGPGGESLIQVEPELSGGTPLPSLPLYPVHVDSETLLCAHEKEVE